MDSFDIKIVILTFLGRKRILRKFSISHPTRPRDFFSQAYATTFAISREISYPQPFYISRDWLEWLSPPPLGQSLVIIIYMAVITLFLTTASIVNDAYYWERIAFRAAWVSVTQVPFVFLLAGKVNIISLVLGSSYADVNWLHRWVSRVLFVTVTIHGSFFLREWIRADFVQTELAMMPMVKYGLGLWGVLAWMNITSLLPLRRLCYEFFVLQHVVSGVVFLWLLSVHIPAYARYNLWMAIAFLLLGRSIRACYAMYRNITVRRSSSHLTAKSSGLGYSANLQAIGDHTTVLTIENVKFTWNAGQHVLLWCPWFGPSEVHPFTISNLPEIDHESGSRKLELTVRSRAGFTKRLNRRARSTHASMRAFITGPFGILPAWNSFETLVLISASTGASFNLPILQSVLDEPCCVRRIDCCLLFRRKSHVDAYIPRLQDILRHPRVAECGLKITIAITGENETEHEHDALKDLQNLSQASCLSQVSTKEAIEYTDAKELCSFNAVGPEESKNQSVDPVLTEELISTIPREALPLSVSFGRPCIAKVIRRPVEASAGETSVVVCGGKSLSSTVRNCVARLSDERAVHKGTGAQGIHLHVEGFGV